MKKIKLMLYPIIGLILFKMQVVNANNANNANNINSFNNKAALQTFINDMVVKHNFTQDYLEQLFARYNTNQEVLHKISNPAEYMPWGKYKNLLISKERIAKGKNFIKKYHTVLSKAESQFGVPKEIIVAILGVESFYGEIVGKFPTLETLATLAFDYPPRSNFFKQELEHFLLLTKEEKLDPNVITGSYAGAMSPAQFISSSYRAYAIDFSNSGSKDLNNMENAIGSVANYFSKHGWKPKGKVANKAKFSIARKAKCKDFIISSADLKSDPKPKYSIQHFKNVGISVKTDKHLDLTQPVSLLEFELNNNTKEYWVGFNNFYVITRYNKSINYAMAIYQLAEALKNS